MSTVASSVFPTSDSFDRQSGSWLERLVFNHRLAVVVLCFLLTALFGFEAAKLQLNANFEKTVPEGHPYIQNFRAHQRDLQGLGNSLRVAVESTHGSIYDPAYMATLQKINDEIFLLPGVDRTFMKSLWTPNTRWVGVTEEGLEGGPVIPEGYGGSERSLHQLKANIARSGEIGQTVAMDAKSSVIYVPLLARDAQGQALDYPALSRRIEAMRSRFSGADTSVHVTGFAKVAGDLIEGLREVLFFFVVAIAIVAGIVYAYTRCIRSTVLVVLTSLVAVVWQLGFLRALGFDLDPYSMLVPFLVFAIGMSHGAQKMNGIMQDIGRGIDRLVAARMTFRRLFLAGLTALIADAVGFAVLLVVDVQVIRELAIAASIGVAMLIVTNLILLPVLLSYVGVSEAAATRSLRAESAGADGRGDWIVVLFGRFAHPRWALGAVACATVLAAVGVVVSQQLKIGDLDFGAPELRQHSRYNEDAAFMASHYGASSDVFAVLVQTPEGGCSKYEVLMRVDALEWELRQLEGVESTHTLGLLNRRMASGLNEGNLKWYDLVRNQDMLNTVTASAPRGLYNESCGLLTIYAYLKDHKADTLTRLVSHVETFAAANDSADARFLLAAGSAGIDAATNIVVKEAWRKMLYMVYAAVLLLCAVTFRSWRAVLIAILPLVLTSILAEVLMVGLRMGVKVATLPVIALGVGIGVDYALYILSVMLARMRAGQSVSQAYRGALLFTGKVVLLTGVTLAAGVATWAFSSIKFQADMGILLVFMFLLNMLGALILLPSLACFLLPSGTGTPHRDARAAST
jgi:predicted RND superfamily exporter protein